MGEVTDRDSLPDESAIIRGESESGIKKKWEDIFHPEEASGVFSDTRLRRGGESGIDRLFRSPDSVSPDLQIEFKDFLNDAYKVNDLDELNAALEDGFTDSNISDIKLDFKGWREKEKGLRKDFEPIVQIRPLWLDQFLLNKNEEEFRRTRGLEVNLKKLAQIWGGKIDVSYEFSKEGGFKRDVLTFKGKNYYGHEIDVEMPMQDMFKLIGIEAKTKDRERPILDRPTKFKSRNMLKNAIETLKLDGRTIQMGEFRIEKKIEIASDKYKISKMSRSMKTEVDNFIRIWSGLLGKIKKIGVGYENGGISSIALEGEKIASLPTGTFAKAFAGISVIRNKDASRKAIGFKFPSAGVSITARTPREKIIDVFKGIRLDGNMLPSSTRIYFQRLS